jgi:hypothetical protein
MTSTGGCLCGAVRFSAVSEPLDAGYCHCKLCQRSTGATVLAWVSYPTASFSYTRGEATRYQSSPHGHREFCSTCGTQIAYRDSQNAATVEVNVGSLDDCDRVRPRYHIWCESQVPWFEIADNLPRFDRSKPRKKDT